MLIISISSSAQAIEEYFDRGAASYIHGKNEEAKSIVMAGLNKYPGNVELAKLRKLLEEEDKNNNQKQDQNQDKQDQNKDQNKDQDKDKQDQNKDQQKQDQQQQNEQQKQDQQDQQQQDQQQQQPKEGEMSKQNVEQILNALQQDEKEVQDKVKLQKAKAAKSKRVEKDW
ncbi:hypothetical protein ACE01N_07455 [Saccharicrinis sp. FJH2]|uniref:hypothetical protein n=1 Tax=Saccharicrinis sp. FJH65 TaxID=3344659 RepID=UPI0035F28C6F